MPKYNPYNRQRLTLNTVDFQPTVFSPIEFKPVEADYSILERAMAKQEERKEKAVTQQSLVKQALGKAREQLHQDDDTLAWFDAKARDIENNIQIVANVGDYDSALQTGIAAAGDIANDTELNARIRTNAQYNEEYELQRKRIGNGINQATFDWWVKNNPYTHENIYDKDRNVIGAKDWKSEYTPVDDLDYAQLAQTAFKLLSPERNESSSTSNAVKGTQTYAGVTKGGQSSYVRVTLDKIYTNINSIIGSNPNNWRAVRQGFQVALNELDKLREERDSYEIGSDEYNLRNQQYEDQLAYFKGENNQTLSNTEEGWKIYTARVLSDNMFAKGMAYDWRTSGSTLQVDAPANPTNPTNPGNGNGNNGSGGDITQSSPANKVVVRKDTDSAQQNATAAGQRAGDRFKFKKGVMGVSLY